VDPSGGPSPERLLWLVDGYNVLRVGFSRATEASLSGGAASEPTVGSVDAGSSATVGGQEPESRGWWTSHRRDALVELVTRACTAGAAVWIVFDGERNPDAPRSPGPAPNEHRDASPSSGLSDGSDGSDGSQGQGDGVPAGPRHGQPEARVIFAPSADDWIVRAVKTRHATDAGPTSAQTIVVTADRPLGGRCRHHGAEIATPKDFVAHCLALASPAASPPRPE
jgi:hypothetical protein